MCIYCSIPLSVNGVPVRIGVTSVFISRPLKPWGTVCMCQVLSVVRKFYLSECFSLASLFDSVLRHLSRHKELVKGGWVHVCVYMYSICVVILFCCFNGVQRSVSKSCKIFSYHFQEGPASMTCSNDLKISLENTSTLFELWLATTVSLMKTFHPVANEQ